MSDQEPPAVTDSTQGIEVLKAVIADPRTGTWALSGLLLLALLTVLYLTRAVAIPIASALVLSLVFLPAVRAMKRLRIPAPLGAGVIVMGLVAAIAITAYSLAGPASVWLDKAPQSIREISVKLSHISGHVQGITEATNEMQDMTRELAQGGQGKQKKQEKQEVTVKDPSLSNVMLAALGRFSIGAVSMLLLLYFLLASGDLFLRKTISMTPLLADKQRAVDIAAAVEAAVSRYLLTVTVINAVLGAAVALAMYLMGVPNPVLWGVMTGVLNFIPYLGDIVSVSVITAVSLLTFNELWYGLLVPAVVLMLAAAEGYLITPLIIGKRMSLNPVVIVLSLLFWGWMWGIPGALLAVPILIALKTLCDRVDSLKNFGAFLGT